MRYRVIQDFSDDWLVGFKKCRPRRSTIARCAYKKEFATLIHTLLCGRNSEWSVRTATLIAVMITVCSNWLHGCSTPAPLTYTETSRRCSVIEFSAVSLITDPYMTNSNEIESSLSTVLMYICPHGRCPIYVTWGLHVSCFLYSTYIL